MASGRGCGVPGAQGGFSTQAGDLLTMRNRGTHYQGTADSPVDGDLPELVTFSNCGATAWSCIDCRTPEGRMYLFEDMELERAKMTLDDWFRRWIDHPIKNGLPA